MKKRGQIFIFVIIVIGVIAFVLLYSLLLRLPPRGSDQDIDAIHSFVNDCVQKTAEESVYAIGQSGGYFIPPEQSTKTDVAFYLYKGANTIPSQDTIEEELSKYIKEALFFCTQQFHMFEDFTITQGTIDSVTTINEGEIQFAIRYPLAIEKGEQHYTLEQFEARVGIHLDKIYNFVDAFITQQENYPSSLCIGCLARLADDYNLSIELFDYDDETIIFAVSDPDSVIYDKTYTFYFAIRRENGV